MEKRPAKNQEGNRVYQEQDDLDYTARMTGELRGTVRADPVRRSDTFYS